LRRWAVVTIHAPYYAPRNGDLYRPWFSAWLDLSAEDVIDLVTADSREEALSRETLEAVCERAGARPDRLVVPLADDAPLIEPHLGDIELVESADDRTLDLVDDLMMAIDEEIDDRIVESEAAVLQPLVGEQLGQALAEAGARLGPLTLGIEPAHLWVEIDGERHRVVVDERGVEIQGAERAIALVLEPRRLLDLEHRAILERAETGALTELVSFVDCFDRDDVPMPVTNAAAELLRGCVERALTWLADGEAGGVEVRDPLGLGPDDNGFRLRISIDGTDPEIWRRVVVPAGVTLEGLHRVIQEALGWLDTRSYRFEIAGEEIDDDHLEATCLADAVKPGESIRYVYDLGDRWEHTIVVEERRDEPATLECIDGAGACPLEDSGGVPGYREMIAALRDPRAPERDELLDWLGKDFDPAAHDLEATNARLRGLARR
jgi:hypothetical protein